MRLFLSGGNEGGNSEIERRFIEYSDKTKTLLYIPNVAIGSKNLSAIAIRSIRTVFSTFGFSSVRIGEELGELGQEEADRIGSVFIEGGNTFNLMKILRETNFADKLASAVRNNVPIYGISAGAVIFRKTIKPAIGRDDNCVKLENLGGLDSVFGYDIWPHYDSIDDGKITEAIKLGGMEKVLAVEENTGLYVYSLGIRAIGRPAYVFDARGKRIIELNEPIRG